jgi:hypothetical protein
MFGLKQLKADLKWARGDIRELEDKYYKLVHRHELLLRYLKVKEVKISEHNIIQPYNTGDNTGDNND